MDSSQQIPITAGVAESSIAITIGYILMSVSILFALIGMLFFSKIAVGGYTFIKVWSASRLLYFATAGISGALFGYLIAKVGSLLRHLERLNSSKQ